MGIGVGLRLGMGDMASGTSRAAGAVAILPVMCTGLSNSRIAARDTGTMTQTWWGFKTNGKKVVDVKSRHVSSDGMTKQQ